MVAPRSQFASAINVPGMHTRYIAVESDIATKMGEAPQASEWTFVGTTIIPF
jgi:hypothetical protein